MAQTAAQHARVTRLADSAAGSYSEAALHQAASRMDAGALAIARRHDPYTVAGDAQRDRQASLLAARLDGGLGRTEEKPLLMRATLGGTFNPAAAPFHLSNALESSRELECLAQAVYYEARGETPSGQDAVAQVVLNRVRHPSFPKSICGVVFQGASARSGCQFSFACDGSMRARPERAAWTRARKVASRALAGTVMSEVGSATHFHTTGVAPNWGPRLRRVAQVGMHVFYRFGGRAGAPGAFTDKPRPSTIDDLPDAPVLTGLPQAPSADGKPVIYVASALSVAKEGGMGGPEKVGPEPASAPAMHPTKGADRGDAVKPSSVIATGAGS